MSEIVNHEEALSLAELQREKSNKKYKESNKEAA
jgi:hypothetical protein